MCLVNRKCSVWLIVRVGVATGGTFVSGYRLEAALGVGSFVGVWFESTSQLQHVFPNVACAPLEWKTKCGFYTTQPEA